jgi:hypothetical protein
LIIILGVITVVGWKYGWLSLRPYSLLQFGTLLTVLIIVFVKRKGKLRNVDLLSGLIIYILAKITEFFDDLIFDQLKLISGHTIKHLLAALAIYQLIKYLKTFPKSTNDRQIDS